MNLEDLKNYWKHEENHTFKGWDFSYINNRISEDTLPWNYKEIVENNIKNYIIVLDMGTGGGEFLLSLNRKKARFYATESYKPNLILCTNILKPYDIEVREVTDDNNLPFEDNYFDLIINKHESFSLSEVTRILKPGGKFITQQVGGKNNIEMSKFLLGEVPNIINHDLGLNEILNECKKCDLEVLSSGEFFPKTYFYDIGALVYYAKIIPWEFPEFTVDKTFDKLLKLNKEIEVKGSIYSTEHRYFIESIKRYN